MQILPRFISVSQSLSSSLSSFSVHLVAFLIICKVELFFLQNWQTEETLKLVFPLTLCFSFLSPT